jgi:hypothetical protein
VAPPSHDCVDDGQKNAELPRAAFFDAAWGSLSMIQLLFAAAMATSAPHLDIERLCRGGLGDNAKEEYKSCVDAEHSAETTLRQKWAQYPAKARDECAHVMSLAPEASYVELQTCIESRTEPVNNAAVVKQRY